jgi:hypothetical protein
VAAETDPAMRVVGAGDEENEQQQECGDAECGIDEALGVVRLIGNAHEDEHAGDAG